MKNFPHYYGLPNLAAKAYFICRHILSAHPTTLFVSQQELDDFDCAGEEFATQGTQVLSFPSTDTGQMNFLHQLLTSHKNCLISASYEDLSTPLPDPQDLQNKTRTLSRGDTLRRQDLLDLLETLGYTRDDYAETPGQYAARGSVVDIFCLNHPQPVRLYFAGNRIEAISLFDVDTHNTSSHLDQALLLPLAFEQKTAVLADYLKQAFYVFDEPGADFDITAFSQGALFTLLPSAQGTDCHLRANLPTHGNTSLLAQEAKRLEQKKIHITVCCLNRGELDRLSEFLQEFDVFSRAEFKISPLTQGFIDEENKLAFICSNEIFNRRFNTHHALKRLDIAQAKRVRFKELQTGDYVVHQDYGIGRYLGLQVMNATENPTDCLALEYRRGSRLYVPMYDFKKVQKYISAGGKRPTLAVLGGTRWKETKQHVKEEAQKAAKEILKLEALRQATPAPVTPGDARIEQEFADSFPYELTPGQQQAIADTLHDLDLSKPMDRVLVGDVGFGKTEVAMRAALKVALSGKQVMVLVPTTILADQHYKTFSKRLAGFPLQVRMLCRFQTAKEQKTVIQELKNGVCDIIIGTHRLLSKDIAFKELGLVIIDEEHRFGVKQKDKIRAASSGVHCLMLSATPIPRTLNQSLSSLRDISLIDTPPRGRTPIKTVVTAWSEELAGAAISQELARQGQVYYVYNTVRDMQERLDFLRKLVPQARICMAHGQMNEKELEQTLWDFNQGKYDVLLASTIIESGIDITNANTLIVEDAHHFGLAQLYQLRGRIGRGNQKAYCYLFHPDWLFKNNPAEDNNYKELAAVYLKDKPTVDPTAEAKERLAALMEFGELGSGFRLALRDMEIRGAGDLLGVRQHGYVNEVGLSLYCDLVAAEVKKLKGQAPLRKLQAKVNLPLTCFIPPDYLPDEAERLKTYKELMGADRARTAAILARLADQCGPVPPEIHNLVQIIELANQAGNLGIYQLDWIAPALELSFIRHFVMPEELPQALLTHYGADKVQFLRAKNGYGLRLECSPNTAPLHFAQQALTFLETLLPIQK
ncbi:MAG: DEAD/DEAH box helicase [Elusimicrobiaceae bacterium]|nr:DEAD/DEAH box helicase [Elusimicrobiaceae bacterium]